MSKVETRNAFMTATYLYFLFVALFLCGCGSDDSSAANSITPPIDPVETIENPLPLFSIQTNGQSIVDEPKVSADFTLTEGDETLYSGKMGIEIRGSSSQMFPKKSFGFETWDADGNDIDVSLLGFPEEEDWILYAPYSDKSLIRNVLIYDLARSMNRYASRTKFVQLNINEQYQGVYVFMEKLKRDNNRIAINKLKDDENEGEDLTGGYILKIDKNNNEGFTDQNSFDSEFGSSLDQTGGDIHFLYDYPDANTITSTQKDYISAYLADFETALASDNFTDVDQGYQAYIDIDSFIDFFILNEISNNVDAYRISTYLTKDKNEKLKIGPIWDFNLGFGNADYCNGSHTDVWAYKFNERCPNDVFLVPFWWSRLLEDRAFVDRLKTRWNTLRAEQLADAVIFARIDEYVVLLDESGALESNFAKWPILGTYVWPNAFVGQNYSQEIRYVKEWITNRTQWLDNAINNL